MDLPIPIFVSGLRHLAFAKAALGPKPLGLPSVGSDSVTLASALKPEAYSFRDGDGNLVVRRGNPNRLGELVQQCQSEQAPEDCRLVRHKPDGQDDDGYVVMVGKDKSDHLTIPIANITGIESPELVGPEAENFFADAWRDGRGAAAQALGLSAGQLPRNTIALTVNSQNTRSQDRLHIHADRLDPRLGQQLHEQLVEGKVDSHRWSNLDPIHGNHQYRAIWVEGADLEVNPFQIVHDQLVAEHGGGQAGEQYARTHMGQHSIAVVAETDASGHQGFLIIDGRDGGGAGGPHDSGSAEEWLEGRADSER